MVGADFGREALDETYPPRTILPLLNIEGLNGRGVGAKLFLMTLTALFEQKLPLL